MTPFSVVRSDALLDPELQKSPAVYMTLCAISTFTTRSKDGYCYFKQETVGDRLNKSRQAVSKDLKKLEALGYIEITPQTYRGFKANNSYRIRYEGEVSHDATSGCDDATSGCTTTQRQVATKSFSIKAKKKKKALTRNEFMREVDKGIKDGDFKRDFPHLSDIEIATEASPAWDWLEANIGEALEGSACVRLRMWIRRGIKDGAIRSKETTEQTVSKGSEYQEPENPIQPWQKRLRSQMPEAVFRSWVRILWHDDHGNLCAPNKFTADRVKAQYADIIRQEFKFNQIIVNPYQPQKELEHV